MVEKIFQNISAQQKLIESNIENLIANLNDKVEIILRIKDNEIPQCIEKVNWNSKFVKNMLRVVVAKYTKWKDH